MSTPEQIVDSLLDGGDELDPKRVLAGMKERNPDFGITDFSNLDFFTRQYLETAFWTDEERLKEEAEEMGFDPDEHDFEWSMEAMDQAKEDCKAFRSDRTVELLDEAGAKDDEQNAHDFWLTRNHHGAGFWDRGYEEEYGRELTAIAERFGEKSTYLGDDGLIYFH